MTAQAREFEPSCDDLIIEDWSGYDGHGCASSSSFTVGCHLLCHAQEELPLSSFIRRQRLGEQTQFT